MEIALAATRATFGDVRYEPGGTCGPRVQPEYQLVLIHEGTVDIEINGRVHRVEAGNVSFHRPGYQEFFQFDLKRPTIHSWCALQVASLTPRLTEAVAQAPLIQPISRRLEGLIEAGLSLGMVDDPLVGALRCTLGEAALLEYVCGGRTGRLRQALAPEPVVKAQRFIERHLHEPLSLDVLAEHSHVTGAHLIRLFGKHLGVTPIQYVWEMRLRRARQLLTDTGLPISEIAWQCGFKTAAHFARAVKQRYDLTPRQVRRSAWEGGEDAASV